MELNLDVLHHTGTFLAPRDLDSFLSLDRSYFDAEFKLNLWRSFHSTLMPEIKTPSNTDGLPTDANPGEDPLGFDVMIRRVTKLYKIANPAKIRDAGKNVDKYNSKGQPGLCLMSAKLEKKYPEHWKHSDPNEVGTKHMSTSATSSAAATSLGAVSSSSPTSKSTSSTSSTSKSSSTTSTSSSKGTPLSQRTDVENIRLEVQEAWQARYRISVTDTSNNIQIMNNEAQYWTPKFSTTESKFKSVAKCKSVCWFDLSASKTIQEVGKYNVYIRIKHETQCNASFTLKASCVNGRDSNNSDDDSNCKKTGSDNTDNDSNDDDDDDDYNRKKRKKKRIHCTNDRMYTMDQNQQNEWQLILIGDINITSSNSVVTGRMYKHDGSWCGGILIDYFVLVPVETSSGIEDLYKKSGTKGGTCTTQ